MKTKANSDLIDRRGFLKSAAVGLAASALPAATTGVGAQAAVPDRLAAAPPSTHQQAMEQSIPEGYTAEQAHSYFVDNPGSDFMVDVIKSLDIEYLAINAGSSFRGLQESIVAYGGNSKPEILTCLHEEQAAALAHGYAKVAGKPMAISCHGTVGIQHASMAIYNAWCDRVPMIVIGGNHLDAAQRNSFVTWVHTAQDPALMVRDFTKWDDNPASLAHFAESMVRAYKIATTPPMGPVVIITDAHLQEEAMSAPRPPIPRLTPTIPPRGDDNAVREAARLLVASEAPVIVADRLARSQEGVDRLVELAEALNAPVIDRGGRMNFPTDHYLAQTGRARDLIAQADVILGLELNDPWGTLNRMRDRVHQDQVHLAQPDVKVICVGVEDLFLKSNYQNFQRYYPTDLSIAGDGQATLPSLIEAVRSELSRQRQSRIAAREGGLRDAHRQMMDESVEAARYAWDASPVSTARLYLEIWNVIKDKDWALTSGSILSGGWPQRLWPMQKHYQHIGDSGGYGVGYNAPASVGAALAHRQHGRFVVNVQSDGDLMIGPGSLWTAAHHRVPLLSVMHNNRGYHQEVMHLQRMALRRRRGGRSSAEIGNVFDDPNIDYSALAKSLGVWSTGPISDPKALGPALRKAVDVVQRGEPALVDVVCQPR